MKCTYILLLVIIFIFCFFTCSLSKNKENENSEESSTDDFQRPKTLSRQRRYLVFPQGSSLQLVYDQIIGIVDFTNLMILGITIAFAWELPSKTPSELVEQLKDTLNEGIIRKDENVEALNYTDSAKPKPLDPYLDRYYYNKQKISDASRYTGQRRNFYQTPAEQQSYRRFDQRRPIHGYSYSDKIRKNQYWSGDRYKHHHVYPQRKHRIYPVFRKRSVEDDFDLTLDDELHLRYHRSTRHDLYKNIEIYLESHGKNGTECVLKALCETGQKQNEVEPGSFVAEIMRAIFSLPEPFESVNNLIHRGYDDAHKADGNCTELYPRCPESLYLADFIF